MLTFGKCLLDVVWHADFACLLVIIPYDCHDAEEGAAPVDGYFLQAL